MRFDGRKSVRTWIDRSSIHILQFAIDSMQLARVKGNVVATIKNSTLQGRKLMVIQPLDGNLKASGKPLVAVDSVGAGAGELVFWCRGKEASFPFEGSEVPTDCTIIGIVDSEAHVKAIGATGGKA
jgi:ethanolamine utilization protein EutN